MLFELSFEDHTIILDALHYYKKVENQENFKQYNDERINQLRDLLVCQLVNEIITDEQKSECY